MDPSSETHIPRLRALPSVHLLLDHARLDRGHPATRSAVREVLEQSRESLLRGESVDLDPDRLADRVLAVLDADRPVLRPVINATGILLHTGLGRAPLAIEAAEAVDRVVRGYCNLEIDLDSGDRGRRSAGVADLLRRVTGAKAAAVVNNNAAATLLALRALAIGREVVVSRGQLVEIGGSYRLPEVFEASGARLREVGTTNKTRLADYERAIGPETAALLRVHASNYRIVGFTESVGIGDLATLAKSRGLWAIDDVGSGALAPGLPPGLSGEPTVSDGLAAGADLVLFSGDKLLGGPQCGILVGSGAAIARVESDPLMRAVRVDKMTLAALEATLRLALEPARAAVSVPLWAFLNTPKERLRERAGVIADRIARKTGWNTSATDTLAYLGGGSDPAGAIPSAGVRIGPPFKGSIGAESAIARSLRLGDPPVVARIHAGAVLLDLRAVPEAADSALLEAVLGSAGVSIE